MGICNLSRRLSEFFFSEILPMHLAEADGKDNPGSLILFQLNRCFITSAFVDS